jgi:hypothetical protein
MFPACSLNVIVLGLQIVRRPQDLKKPLRVKFISKGVEEEAVDEGGKNNNTWACQGSQCVGLVVGIQDTGLFNDWGV